MDSKLCSLKGRASSLPDMSHLSSCKLHKTQHSTLTRGVFNSLHAFKSQNITEDREK